jgi:hypothetical protein
VLSNTHRLRWGLTLAHEPPMNPERPKRVALYLRVSTSEQTTRNAFGCAGDWSRRHANDYTGRPPYDPHTGRKLRSSERSQAARIVSCPTRCPTGVTVFCGAHGREPSLVPLPTARSSTYPTFRVTGGSTGNKKSAWQALLSTPPVHYPQTENRLVELRFRSQNKV